MDSSWLEHEPGQVAHPVGALISSCVNEDVVASRRRVGGVCVCICGHVCGCVWTRTGVWVSVCIGGCGDFCHHGQSGGTRPCRNAAQPFPESSHFSTPAHHSTFLDGPDCSLKESFLSVCILSTVCILINNIRRVLNPDDLAGFYQHAGWEWPVHTSDYRGGGAAFKFLLGHGS